MTEAFADRFLSNLGGKKRSRDLAATLRLLAPDQRVQGAEVPEGQPLSPGQGVLQPGATGTVSNQPQRDALAAGLGNSPDMVSALQAIAGKNQFSPFDLGPGQARFNGQGQKIAEQQWHPMSPGAGGSAKFYTMHASGRASINEGGQQHYVDPPYEPVNYSADKPLATQQMVTDSAGNSQLIWQKVPYQGAPASGASPAAPAPGAPPGAPAQPQGMPPPPSAPGATLSTGPQAAQHAGDVVAAQKEQEMWARRRTDLPKAKNAARLAIQTSNQLLNRVDDIAADPNLASVVGIDPSRVISQLPGTQLANIRLKIDSLKKALSLEALNQLRAASPTGGAIGQVTEGEYPILYSKISALNENMTAGEFAKQLADLRRQLAYTGIATEKAFRDEYGAGYTQRFPGEDVALTIPEDVQPEVAKSIAGPAAPASGLPRGWSVQIH